MVIKRGDIYYADLRPVLGSEQGGIRPVVIIQNEAGNKHSPTVICAAITSKMNKAKLPTHVELSASKYDISKDSVILLEQVRTIDKRRLKEQVCHLDQEMLNQVKHKYFHFAWDNAEDITTFEKLKQFREGFKDRNENLMVYIF